MVAMARGVFTPARRVGSILLLCEERLPEQSDPLEEPLGRQLSRAASSSFQCFCPCLKDLIVLVRETFSAWRGDPNCGFGRGDFLLDALGPWDCDGLCFGRYTVPWEKIDTGQMLVTVRELAQQAGGPPAALQRAGPFSFAAGSKRSEGAPSMAPLCLDPGRGAALEPMSRL